MVLLLSALLFANSTLCSPQAPPAPMAGAPDHDSAPPNIVLILADDLGWTDLGCQGSGYYLTPALDALAEGGMRFTDAYAAAPNCAPTRAALLSGLAAPRTGVYTVGNPARGKEEFRRLVPAPNLTELGGDFLTFAERLQQAGYQTAHLGKWHLGAGPGTGPEAQGFSFNLGGDHRGHPPSHHAPYRRGQAPPPPGLEDAPEGEYLTDRLTEEAVRWIEANADRPFLLYLPHFAVHTPIQAPAATTERYRERPAAGGHDHPEYAAMVEHLDRSVGRILDALDRCGLRQRTLVIFSSDNGGLGGYRAAGIDGGAEITDNAPLRGGKGMLEEGGIRVPLLISWPGVIAPGAVSAEPITTVDLYPTLLAAAGLEPAIGQELDGVDLTPLLRGERQRLAARDLVWHMPVYLEASAKRGSWRCTPSAAIRRGRWKLIERFETGEAELYDLQEDIGEQRNLAGKHQQLTGELRAALAEWRQRTGAAMPTPKPAEEALR